ncbi:MAG: hypothetical protein OXN89_12170 [Bryobacterales bacterium]|nr:hypothetical protein [Bryobacterales bacterium]
MSTTGSAAGRIAWKPDLWKLKAFGITNLVEILVTELGEPRYKLTKPIRVMIRRIGSEDFEAVFRKANIAISGSDWDDARQSLVAEILDTFEMLLHERSLCPPAAEQLRILRTYIERA